MIRWPRFLSLCRWTNLICDSGFSDTNLIQQALTKPFRSVYRGSSIKQWCAVQTAGARIRAVRNPLFYGCPLGRPFLILGMAAQQARGEFARA